ncbi:MAG: oligosaccharide flippase family protein [Prevotella sp.]|nr:oligosaccharide flippase family protein [Prevotella sp.]
MANNNSQSFVRGLSSQTLISLTLGVLDIISFSIMSRLLTERDFGYFAAIVAVASIFSALADAGVGSAIVHKKNINNEYINNAFTICFIIGIIVTGILFISADLLANLFVDSSMALPLRFFSVSIFFQCLTSVNLSILQKKYQFFKMGIANIISLIITTILAVVLALFGLGYYSIIAKVVFASILTFVISKILAKENYSFSINRVIFKQIVGYGGWLMLSAIFRNCAHQIDRLLMPRLFSVDTLGTYTRPKEFMYSITQKINGILDTVMFPHLSEIQDDTDKLKNAYLSAIYLFGLMGLLLNFFFIFNSKLLITIFFGEKWIYVDILFKILSIYPIFLFWGRMGDIFLRSLGFTKYQFYLRILQLITSLIAVILTYQLGIEIVSCAIIFSYICVMIIKSVFIAIKIDVRINDVLKSAIKSLRITSVYLPLMGLAEIVIPNTIIGYLLQLTCFLLISIIAFIFYPNLIGKEYERIAYPLIQKVKLRIRL